MIKATIESDRGDLSLSFDAEEYFAQMSYEEIMELVRTEFGGDFPADAVAEYYQQRSDKMDAFFADFHKQRVRARGEGVDEPGFEVYVNKEQAVEWIKNNNHLLYLCMLGREELVWPMGMDFPGCLLKEIEKTPSCIDKLLNSKGNPYFSVLEPQAISFLEQKKFEMKGVLARDCSDDFEL